MCRHTTYHLDVQFGDCDPAGIAFYANFFRWFDAGLRHFFEERGVPAWRELQQREGIIGTPVVEAGSRHLLPVSYGDRIAVRTWIEAWQERGFEVRHTIVRGEQVIAEGREMRIFATRHPTDPSRIKTAAVPAFIRALCT